MPAGGDFWINNVFFFALKEVCFTLSLEEEDKLPRCFSIHIAVLEKFPFVHLLFRFKLRVVQQKYFFDCTPVHRLKMELIITWFR